MKYVVLTASVCIQICLGGVYAWSEVVPGLHADYGLSMAQTQLIFGSVIAVFTVSMVFAGRLQRRRGPRLTALIGGLLFGAGYLLASFSQGQFWLLLLGIGGIAGVGTGFGYVCPLATCVQWFPRNKGLVTGIAVAGFGGGAVVLSMLIEALLARGFDLMQIFRTIGLLYGLVVVAAALAMSTPAGLPSSQRRPMPRLLDLKHDPAFWALVVGMFSGTFAGLLVIGSLKPIGLQGGLDGAAATLAISAFAIGNAAGRVSWGWIADRLGMRAIPLSLACLALGLSVLWQAMSGPAAFVAVSGLIGFGFGACFVVYAAQVAHRYGAASVPTVYPLIFLAYGASGIAGPSLGGELFDLTGNYHAAILLSLAVVGGGAAVATGLSLLAWRRQPASADERPKA